jgi:hypothetical protein
VQLGPLQAVQVGPLCTVRLGINFPQAPLSRDGRLQLRQAQLDPPYLLGR